MDDKVLKMLEEVQHKKHNIYVEGLLYAKLKFYVKLEKRDIREVTNELILDYILKMEEKYERKADQDNT